MFVDESENKAETRAFLSAGSTAPKFEKVKAKWLNPDRESFSVTRFLGRLATLHANPRY